MNKYVLVPYRKYIEQKRSTDQPKEKIKEDTPPPPEVGDIGLTTTTSPDTPTQHDLQKTEDRKPNTPPPIEETENTPLHIEDVLEEDNQPIEQPLKKKRKKETPEKQVDTNHNEPVFTNPAKYWLWS